MFLAPLPPPMVPFRGELRILSLIFLYLISGGVKILRLSRRFRRAEGKHFAVAADRAAGPAHYVVVGHLFDFIVGFGVSKRYAWSYFCDLGWDSPLARGLMLSWGVVDGYIHSWTGGQILLA